jgi:hypothetical protein
MIIIVLTTSDVESCTAGLSSETETDPFLFALPLADGANSTKRRSTVGSEVGSKVGSTVGKHFGQEQRPQGKKSCRNIRSWLKSCACKVKVSH